MINFNAYLFREVCGTNNIDKFVICNPTPLETYITFSLVKDDIGQIYSFDPKRMILQPGEKQVPDLVTKQLVCVCVDNDMIIFYLSIIHCFQFRIFSAAAQE